MITEKRRRFFPLQEAISPGCCLSTIAEKCKFSFPLQEAMARQAPTYAAHIAKIRQQALEETAAEQDRLRGQLGRVESEMKRLQACCDADRQATKDLMEVEKIQVSTV